VTVPPELALTVRREPDATPEVITSTPRAKEPETLEEMTVVVGTPKAVPETVMLARLMPQPLSPKQFAQPG
jgi:hypothetical protein